MPRKAIGTVVQLPDGRFQAVVTLGDGKRKRSAPFPVGTTKTEAKEWAFSISEQWRGGAPKSKGGLPRKGTLEFRCGSWHARMTVTVNGESVRKWFNLDTTDEDEAKCKLGELAAKQYGCGRKRTGSLQFRSNQWYAVLTVDVDGATTRKWVALGTESKALARRKLDKLTQSHGDIRHIPMCPCGSPVPSRRIPKGDAPYYGHPRNPLRAVLCERCYRDHLKDRARERNTPTFNKSEIEDMFE